ncbi:MAG: hypothetical protein GF355_13340 [Candidatus Eisenbacteria bacterium]|nr:hypothetical protein [Candidatus Eisenbacteria bacterium]
MFSKTDCLRADFSRNWMRAATAVAVVAGSLLASVHPKGTEAETWVVYPDGSGDAPTIAAAFDSVAPYDSVLAMPGTHYEHDLELPMWVFFLGLNAETTVIDAGGQGRVMSYILPDEEFNISVIKGLTLRGGVAEQGAGLYVFADNLYGTLFLDVRDVIFEDNEAERDGGGLYAYNGGVRLKTSTFRRNVAHRRGGAIAAEGTASVRFMQPPLFLFDNEASVGGAVWAGEFADIDVFGSVIAGNQAWEKGGVAAVQDWARLGISHSTLVGNGAPEGSVFFRGDILPDGLGALSTSIIAFNYGRTLAHCEGSGLALSGRCNAIFGNEGGDGCFNHYETLIADPLFCDMENRDFTLQEDSPCLLENMPDSLNCGPMGVFAVPGCPGSPTRTETTSWGRIKTMFRR